VPAAIKRALHPGYSKARRRIIMYAAAMLSKPINVMVALFAAGLLAAICALAQAAPPYFQEMAKHYDYDRAATLDLKELSRQKHNSVTTLDLTYASPKGGRVPAYLVIPNDKPPLAAILWGHWMMPGSAFMDRREFLREAQALARSGVVSLLIDGPQARIGFVPEKDLERSGVQDALAKQQQVIDLRRGVDLLLARSDIDPTRLAYVGHSFDAAVGGILAAVEPRIQNFVLMAGSYADEEWIFNESDPAMVKLRQQIGEEKVRGFFRDYGWSDPVHYLPHTTGTHFFLQFATKDPIPEKLARHYFDLFSASDKQMRFYQAEHALNPAARADRDRWLHRRLRLPRLDDAALTAVPPLDQPPWPKQ